MSPGRGGVPYPDHPGDGESPVPVTPGDGVPPLHSPWGWGRPCSAHLGAGDPGERGIPFPCHLGRGVSHALSSTPLLAGGLRVAGVQLRAPPSSPLRRPPQPARPPRPRVLPALVPTVSHRLPVSHPVLLAPVGLLGPGPAGFLAALPCPSSGLFVSFSCQLSSPPASRAGRSAAEVWAVLHPAGIPGTFTP